jgi:hypothetical protein
MFFSVSVLCVLCLFVVKNPLSAAVLHRTRMIAARMSTTPCLNHARYSLDVGHPCRAFSALHASLISVDRFLYMTQLIPMSSNVIIFMVNLPRQPLASQRKGFICGGMWGFLLLQHP